MESPTKTHPATPGCMCDRCKAVFEEWGEQAHAFQEWYVRHGRNFLVQQSEKTK